MKIQYVTDTSRAVIPADFHDAGTICVYSDGYAVPEIRGAEFIPFHKFRGMYTSITTNKMVVVGLNKMITPQNRCDLIFEFLQENTASVNKISIDTSPFIGEPWRFWWHFSIAGINPWGWPHSYAVETIWKKWFERDVETCAVADIGKNIIGVYSDILPLSCSFEFYPPQAFEVKSYSAVKEAAFEKHDTPKQLIAFMTRNLSGLTGGDRVSFDMYRERSIVRFPDLKFYRFVAEENQRRQKIYNCLISGGC